MHDAIVLYTYLTREERILLGLGEIIIKCRELIKDIAEDGSNEKSINEKE